MSFADVLGLLGVYVCVSSIAISDSIITTTITTTTTTTTIIIIIKAHINVRIRIFKTIYNGDEQCGVFFCHIPVLPYQKELIKN